MHLAVLPLIAVLSLLSLPARPERSPYVPLQTRSQGARQTVCIGVVVDKQTIVSRPECADYDIVTSDAFPLRLVAVEPDRAIYESTHGYSGRWRVARPDEVELILYGAS